MKSWLAQQFAGSYRRDPDHWFESNQFFELIHAYHRVFYEHREFSISSDMGTPGSQSGICPVLEGSGRRSYYSWSLYDRHYGPLFDGTAFSAIPPRPASDSFRLPAINP